MICKSLLVLCGWSGLMALWLMTLSGCGENSDHMSQEGGVHGPLVFSLMDEGVESAGKATSLHYTFLSNSEVSVVNRKLKLESLPTLEEATSILSMPNADLIVLFGKNGNGTLVHLQPQGAGGYQILEASHVKWDDVVPSSKPIYSALPDD